MYRNLKYFFSAYFHQDWHELEGHSVEDVVLKFTHSECKEVIHDVLNELQLFLQTEYITAHDIYALGAFIIPNEDVDGNVRKWLNNIYQVMLENTK